MAAASLGRLTLDLLVRLGSFEQGMNQADRRTRQTTDNMNKAFAGFKDQVADALGGTQLGSLVDSFNTKIGSLKGGAMVAGAAFAGMAVGGIAVAFGALSKLAIDTAKADAQLLVLANRANTSAENFQILQYAASGLGVTQDQLGSILADVQEKLGEFSATSGGEAVEFFDALKNNTKMTEDQIKSFGKTLQGKDGIEAIQILNDKMDELGVTSQERRFVFESLANDLGNLAPLFAENGDLLNKYGDALKEAGVIKSKEALEQSKLLAAQTESVRMRFDGLKSQLADQMMPALNSLVSHFIDGATKGGQFGGIIQSVGVIAKGVGIVIIGVAASIEVMIKVIAGLIDQAKNVAKTALDVWNADGVVAKAKATWNGLANAGTLAVGTFVSGASAIQTAMDGAGNILDSATAKTDKLTEANLAIAEAAKKSAAGLRTNTKEADENAKAKDAQAKAAAKLAKEQDNLNKIIGASEIKSLGLRLKSSETISGGGVKAYTAQFAKMTQDLLGSDLTRFTALNDGYHQGKGGKHPIGQAFDFTVKDAAEANRSIQRIQEMAKKYGFAIKTLNEYSDPSKKATGGHIHVSVLGYKGTSETLKDAQALVSIASDTQEKIGREQQSIALQYADEQIKLKMRFESEKQRIEEAYINNPSLKTLYINKAQEVYDRDLNAYRKNEMRKREEAWRTLDEVNNALTQSRINSLALITMNQQQLANWNRSNAQASGYSQLGDSLYSGVNAINQNELLSEQEKQTQLLSIYEQYLQARNALSAQYAQEDIEAINQQHASTIASYANMFGSLGELVKGYAGETSSAYTAILAIQKGANLASVLMNSVTAISAAWASAPFPYNLPAVAMATVETGALQATLQAFTPNISGMAHNGIDNIPKEGTWLLDGGERVLNPEQNKDLTNYLSDRQAANTQNQPIESPQVNVRVMNSWDDSEYYNALAAPQGEKIVMNIIKRNRTKLGI